MNLFMYRQPMYSEIYINKIWKPERNFSSDWTNDNYFPNALIIENIWAEYFIFLEENDAALKKKSFIYINKIYGHQW